MLELEDMDWTNDENQQLKKLISNDDDESVDCEIEGHIYMMIKMMKKKHRIVSIDMHFQSLGAKNFTLDVNTGHNVEELIDQVNELRKVLHFYQSSLRV